MTEARREIEELDATKRALVLANEQIARRDEWLAGWHRAFPVGDPVIARRMVEDRAKAEVQMDLADAQREIEELRADLDFVLNDELDDAGRRSIREARTAGD